MTAAGLALFTVLLVLVSPCYWIVQNELAKAASCQMSPC